MRVLFASQPIRSHVHSLVPVALAAQRMGHQVALASGASLERLARRLGFGFVPCGLDAAVVRELDAILPPDMREALADAPIVVRRLVAFSGGLGPAFASDLLERGPAWRPDVIVREPVEFGGFDSLHSALWRGLPAVVVPLEGGDQGFTAERLAGLGASLHVPGPLPSVEALRTAIARVVSVPSFAAAAGDLGVQMQPLPPPDEAVEQLAALPMPG